jgi:hypothetical protein
MEQRVQAMVPETPRRARVAMTGWDDGEQEMEMRGRSITVVAVLCGFIGTLGCSDDASGPRGPDVAIEDSGETDVSEDAVSPEDVGDDTEDVGDLSGGEAFVMPNERVPGETRPLTARCDDSEPMSCFLPWPSSRFLALNEEAETGVRVTLADDVLPPPEDLAALNVADGFSRITPLVIPAPADCEPEVAVAAMRLFVASGEGFGDELLLRNVYYTPRRDSTTGALVGYVRRPMAATTDHVVVVTAIPGTEPLVANRWTRVALGIDTPESQEEADLWAYHAPSRQIVAEAGIDPAAVARVWDFRTRSERDPLGPLLSLAEEARVAVRTGVAAVEVAEFEVREGGSVSAIASGTITWESESQGTIVAPFRVALPRGEGSYRVVLFGHGAGGNVGDQSFDDLITSEGAAKVGVEVEGWTDTTIGASINALINPVSGSVFVASGMVRSQARIAAIHEALEGPLAERLSADELLGTANPAAGRRPDTAMPIWAGGSLGGVTGMVYAFLEPRIVGGVLNVPGAGFTHWLGGSVLYEVLALVLEDNYPEVVDIQLVSAMAQGAWDVVDGAVWAGTREEAPIFAIQISIGDPVMPNVGSEMVATAMNAVHLGVPVVEIPGLDKMLEEVGGRSAVTQFVAPGTNANDIHGFTIKDTEAARAAQEQFRGLIRSLWDGAPVIRTPDACMAMAPPGLCNFSNP